MAPEQKLITPLVESSIQMEPGTVPGMKINSRIQRAWSFMFGRRDNILQPVFANQAGMLGVVNLDMTGWELVYNAAGVDDWTDMGRIVDLVMFVGLNDTDNIAYMDFGMKTGVITHAFVPQSVNCGFLAVGIYYTAAGYFHGRCRWYRGHTMFGVEGRVMAYTAPKR